MYVDLAATATGLGNSPRLVVPRRYRYDWALFSDWCTACDHRALPAHPSVLAEFLDDHPAADGTQRRRVAAINSVHAGAGLPAPGRAETIRQLLNTTRADRLARVGERVAQVVPRLPVTGWPGGLFGRRDALLLTLAAAGLSFEEISRLRRTDVTTEHDELVVRAGEGWVRVTARSGAEPVAVYRNWVEVLGFLDRYPSTQLLAGRLDKGTSLSAFADSACRDERPLLTPIDRWGHTPFDPTQLTGHSIAALVRAHLAGQAPVHKRPPARRPTTSQENAPVPVVAGVELDQGYYDRGIAARRNAHIHLENVTDILDGIEDEADKLLADLLAILDGTEID